MKRRSKRRSNSSPMELDSFLDIVANLVGIMIILVVVFGLQMGESLSKAPNKEVEQATEKLAALKSQENQVFSQLRKRQSDHRLLEDDLQKEKLLTNSLQYQRNRLLRNVQLAEALIAQKEKQLSKQQQVQFATFQKAAENENVIRQLGFQAATASAANQNLKTSTKREVVKHYPTPIAKTAFGREVHFRLKGNKIVHAPLDDLIQRLRSSWETHVSEMRVGNTVTETLGPIGDFRIQYSLEAKKQKASTGSGVVYRRVVRLTRFSLIPVHEDLGVPVPVSLATGSQVDKILKRYSPNDTTVSVWVYPDSYSSFLKLRKHLIQKGFRVAVWPLSDGQYINGGPDGFRTSAQ